MKYQLDTLYVNIPHSKFKCNKLFKSESQNMKARSLVVCIPHHINKICQPIKFKIIPIIVYKNYSTTLKLKNKQRLIAL